MKVPKAVEAVFDKFPLVAYPPILSATELKRTDEESRKFYFESTQTDENFGLGIFNAIEVKGKIIPSDPVSCGLALILADLNNLKLPSSANKVSNHCLVKLSMYSSPNDELPILIEDQRGTRSIKTMTTINTIISKRITTEEDLINQLFVDLYDCYFLCLLTESIPTNAISQIFGIDTTLSDKLILADIFHKLPSWNNFNVRNPQLFENDYNLADYLKGKNSLALAKYYDIKLSQLSHQLPLLLHYKESKFIQLKLLGYFITIHTTLPSTRLGKLIASDQEALSTFINKISSL